MPGFLSARSAKPRAKNSKLDISESVSMYASISSDVVNLQTFVQHNVLHRFAEKVNRDNGRRSVNSSGTFKSVADSRFEASLSGGEASKTFPTIW